jgi:hypothetical protein
LADPKKIIRALAQLRALKTFDSLDAVNTTTGPQFPKYISHAFANVVHGIQPGGEPWVIRALSAEVKVDGRIHVEGRGLLLSGGNAIGTNGGQSVFATLICGPLPNGPFTVHSTPVANAVALAADGDFTIDDILSPAPSNPCDNPVLLIRNVGGVWFAAGIPLVIE